MTAIDPATKTVIGNTIDVGVNPREMTYDGSNSFVVNSGGDTVSKLPPR